jgi:quinol monooxygenase YgiN
VQETEPGALTYQWFRAGTAEEPKIVVLEMYASFAHWHKDEKVEMLTVVIDMPTRPPWTRT